MSQHVYSVLRQARGQGRTHVPLVVPWRSRAQRPRLFGRFGGPRCEILCEGLEGTVVSAPVQEALDCLRARAWREEGADAPPLIRAIVALRDDVSGERLTGEQAWGHLLMMRRLERKEEA